MPAALVSSMMLIKRLRTCGERPSMSVLRLRDDLRAAQQLRAQAQLRLVGRAQIHLKANPLVLGEKANDAAGMRELARFADREDGLALELLQRALQLARQGLIDEQQVATIDLRCALVACDDDRPAVHLLALHDGIEVLAERIRPENADHDRIRGAFERLFRPFDELREVEEENRFELVLRCRNS